MAKTIPRATLQQFLRDNMTYQEYSFDEMWMLYTEILSREGMLEYKPMYGDSLRRALNQWADVEGGWLIIDKTGIAPIYYKRCCHRNNLSRKKWHDRADKLMNWGKALWPR